MHIRSTPSLSRGPRDPAPVDLKANPIKPVQAPISTPSNMARSADKKPFFGFVGGWLTFWLTLACATDMTLFGYDQGVFSML